MIRKLDQNQVDKLQAEGAKITVKKKASPKKAAGKQVSRPVTPSQSVEELKAMVTLLQRQNEALKAILSALQNNAALVNVPWPDRIRVTERAKDGRIVEVAPKSASAGVTH